MKFKKYVSGGIVTLVPDGKVFYTLEEGDAMKEEIARLRKIISDAFFADLDYQNQISNFDPSDPDKEVEIRNEWRKAWEAFENEARSA